MRRDHCGACYPLPREPRESRSAELPRASSEFGYPSRIAVDERQEPVETTGLYVADAALFFPGR